MSGRTTLKSYFLTGATPTEANFADLIDSVLVLSEDLTDSLTTDSSVKALTASGAKSLNDSLTSLTTRVVTLENAENNFKSDYYTKSEVDTQINTVSGLFNNLPYAGQISELSDDLEDLEDTVDGKANSVHVHAISDITNLTTELSAKATTTYVDNVATTLTAAINAIEPGSDESDDVERLDALVEAINTVISGLPKQSDLDGKSDQGHTHKVDDIDDISDIYYDKTETDTLLSNVTPKEHTHVEADITNLDKYTQAATDLKIFDHSNRKDNPHGVTKAQVSLGNVDNLSVVSIFQTPQAQLLATKAEVEALGAESHAGNKDNPHEVNKTQVGLGNVPNVNFQSLLDDHLNASNPHNINLSFFDVYAKAETDSRIQFYINALRYSASPGPTDSAGAIGDYAYDADAFYVKTGPTKWETIPWLRKTTDGKIIFTDPIDAQGGINVSQFLDVDGDVYIDGKLTVTKEVSLGSSLNVIGTVSIGQSLTVLSSLRAEETSVKNLSSDGSISAQGGISGASLNTGSGSIQGGTITGTSLSAGTGDVSGGTFKPNNTVKAQTGDLILEGKEGKDVQVNDKLQITGNTTVGTSSTNANLVVNGNSTISGNLTVQGTTTSIDTTNLVIEDNIVVLNKNQTGTPANSLKSGIEVERGSASNAKFYWDESSDKWIADIGGTLKTVSFTDTPPASHTHTLSEITDSGTAAALNVPASGNAGAAEVVKGNDTRLTDGRTPLAHTHPISNITGLQAALNGKAASSHSHAISNITGLQSALNGKAAASHSHSQYLTQAQVQALLYSK